MPSQEAPPTGISVEDWAVAPPSVRAWARTVEQRLARLEERLKQTSRNSSKPPSSDPPTLARPARSPSERKTGGQPGHPGYLSGVGFLRSQRNIVIHSQFEFSHLGAG